jgi:uncharacterized protein YbjT (DUF2867 family)
MRIAITGGTGFVGRHLADRLRAGGHEVVVISRRTRHGLGSSAADGLTESFRGCDAIVHCAGINRELGAQTYDAAPFACDPPDDLAPMTPFDAETIRRGLPEPGGFGPTDLRCAS